MNAARTLFAAVLAVALGASCSKCASGSDAERAAAERALVDAKLKGSLTLLPYRAVKTLTRSKGAANRPAAWDKMGEALDATLALTHDGITASEGGAVAGAYGKLAVAIAKSKGELDGHDEDEFPLLWATVVQQPLPAAWYDNGAEHLGLATAWLVIDVADDASMKKVPAADVIYYESSRATTGAPDAPSAWPREATLWSQLLRGAAFCNDGYHYAAEEELTRYLADVDAQPITTPLALAQLTLPAADTQRILSAAGHFVRAWNRMGMNRDDAAADDIEAGLKNLDGLGIDNELTQWGWAFVHYQRGNYPESAAQLEKLALSPNIDDKTRAEIKAAAASLSGNEKVPLLGKARGGALIAKALLARAGGIDHILDVVLGSEPAAKAKQPLDWLKTSREHLAHSVDLKQIGGDAKAKAIDLAGDRLDALKRAANQRTDAGQ